MKTTRVFDETAKAYLKGKRIIANRGGTRSSKTYSELQLCYIIAKRSKRKRVITVVSHSFPHLHGGAIRDLENIIENEGENIDDIRTKNPYVYNINNSIIEFVGFDKPGKALGAARDILLINEADKMSFNICHQLIQRTREVVFMDWNPAEAFWFDNNKFEERKDCQVIHSTFYDNIENLTQGQLDELKQAKHKALEEDKAGQRGYWWNWWQVYGLGLKGQLEGVIFQNWSEFTEMPSSDYYNLYVIDWGGMDPTVLCGLFIDGDSRHIYVREYIYQSEILNSELISKVQRLTTTEMVICDSARKDKIFELMAAGINAIGATKGAGSILDGIDLMQDFQFFIHKDSKNVINEFKTYKRAKNEKTGQYMQLPEDKNNHAIDAIRYGVRFYRKNIKPI